MKGVSTLKQQDSTNKRKCSCRNRALPRLASAPRRSAVPIFYLLRRVRVYIQDVASGHSSLRLVLLFLGLLLPLLLVNRGRPPAFIVRVRRGRRRSGTASRSLASRSGAECARTAQTADRRAGRARRRGCGEGRQGEAQLRGGGGCCGGGRAGCGAHRRGCAC